MLFGKKKRAKKAVYEENLIVLENVTKSYQNGNGAHALNGVNLKIKKGEFVFIVGDSGSYVNGENLAKLKHRQVPMYRRNLGVVFQDFRLLKDRNVYENVAFAQRIVQTPNREIKKNVPAILSIVGLAGKYKAKPKQLSGGEQQRVAMARALINKPPILLCDEPTGNLDPKNSWEIMKLLEQINKRGTTIIVVTHNKEIVNEMQKRVITLKKGVIISDEEKGGYIDED